MENSVVVKIIIVLLVILAAAQVVIHYKDGVKPLLALIDKSILDKDMIDRYAALEGEDKEAIDSMKALSYGINRLAWFDTYATGAGWDWDEDVNIAEELQSSWYVTRSGSLVKGDAPEGYEDIGSYQDFGRKYGKTSVIPTIMDANLIFYSADTKDNTLKQFAKDMVDCMQMFREVSGGMWEWDKSNVRCFAADFSSVGSTIITKDDIPKALTLLEEDESLCDDACQDVLWDLSGGSWWDFWNTKNWRFDVSGGKISKENTRANNPIRICGDIQGLDEIYITDDLSRCKTPADALIFTMTIKDFSLPQEVKNPHNILKSHGDPKYIMYYEVFPEGADSSWESSSYGELGTFITAEVILFGIQRIPYIGRPLSSLLDKGLNKVVRGIGTATERLVPKSISFGTNRIVVGVGQITYTAGARLGEYRSSRIIIGAIAARLNEIATSDKKDVMNNLSSIWDSMIDLYALIAGYSDALPTEDIHASVRDYITMKYSGLYVFENYYSMAVEEFYGDDTEKSEASLGRKYDYEKAFSDLSDSYFSQGKELAKEGAFTEDFKKDLAESFAKVENKRDFSVHLLEDIDARVQAGYLDARWRFNVAAAANEKLLEMASLQEIDEEQRKTELQAIFLKNTEIISGLEGKDRKDYYRRKDMVLAMALEEQEKNKDLQAAIGKDADVLSKALLTGVVPEGRASTGSLGFDKISVERMILMNELAINTYRTASISEKYYFVGTNALALRTPYKATVRIDDSWTRSWKWPRDYDKYNDYFDHYGGYWEPLSGDASEKEDLANKYFTEKYFGLLPEANRYYMSLSRDKVWYWFSQPNERMHLASPCSANVMMRVTKCECYGSPKIVKETDSPLKKLMSSGNTYETGTWNDEIDMTLPDFDGENEMLYRIDEETGQVVKDCRPKGIGDYLPWSDDPYTPLCIEFDPLLDGSDPNYCYQGVKAGWVGTADLALTWGLPIFCTVAAEAAAGTVTVGTLGAGAPTIVVSGPLAGALCSIAGQMILAPIEQACTAWPSHGSEFFTCD
jgi:hypothetical protein